VEEAEHHEVVTKANERGALLLLVEHETKQECVGEQACSPIDFEVHY